LVALTNLEFSLRYTHHDAGEIDDLHRSTRALWLAASVDRLKMLIALTNTIVKQTVKCDQFYFRLIASHSTTTALKSL
jgi:hypothetical protein